MIFIIVALAVCFGILMAVYIVYMKVKKSITSAMGLPSSYSLKEVMNVSNEMEKDEYSREKSVKGLTKLLLPEIIHDFPDFNESLIYKTCESNYRKIFNAIESQDGSSIRYDNDMIYLREKIDCMINDMKSCNEYEKFDDVRFYRHAIQAYRKEKGKATLKISTTMSYCYDTNRKDIKAYSSIRKSTRYTSEFVYVYNESELKQSTSTLSIQCPNCGAPIRNVELGYCEYCSTGLKHINLKLWRMTSYKEDY